MAVLFFATLLLFAAACGPEGAGDTSGGIPGGASGSSGGGGTSGGVADDDGDGDDVTFMKLVGALSGVHEFEDADGNFLVSGYVQNMGEYITHSVEVTFTFFDDSGEVIRTMWDNPFGITRTFASTGSELDSYDPGGIYGFMIDSDTPADDVASYMYSIRDKAGGMVDTEIQVATVGAATPFNYQGLFAVEGVIENQGTAIVYDPVVRILAKDSDNHIIGRGYGGIEGGAYAMEGGDQAVYTAISSAAYEDVSDWELWPAWSEGGLRRSSGAEGLAAEHSGALAHQDEDADCNE